jgi:thioredoxin reductase/ferredoxin
MITVWIGLFVAFAVAGALLLEVRRKRIESDHRAVQERAVEAGMNEPASLHPVIDVERCIGSGACVSSCPEGKVLGFVDGHAELIMGSKCVGHGRCVAECPVDAIRLVFGTAERGVDIPHVSENFETNVRRLYVVGELGGMGLVRNAIRQGVDATRHLGRQLASLGARPAGVHDVVIVGAGPAGVAAAVTARELGLDLRLLERERKFGGAILHFPRKKVVMTEPVNVPGYGTLKVRELPKEELLEVLEKAAVAGGVAVECGVEVRSIRPEGEGAACTFRVALADGSELRSRAVMLAIGRRGMPNRLGVPGEDLPKVAYSLLEPELYRGQKIVVVGGGNSAIEACVALADEDATEVTLSYRRSALSRVAEKNREKLEAAVAASRVRLLLESEVRAIDAGVVRLETKGGSVELANDSVFIFAGGVLPVELLREAGIRVEKKYGEA